MAHLGENRWGNTPEQLDANTPPDAERKGFSDPGRPDRLVVDGDQIRAFVDAVFRYASPGLFISLRTFRNGGRLDIRVVKTKGPDREELIDAATKQAQKAANSGVNAVFCPPLAGFSSRDKADEAHLSEGYVLTVECDERPGEARQKLEDLLGPATIVVASGGRWTNLETREVEAKLHLHWCLKEPATGDDLARLKAARLRHGERPDPARRHDPPRRSVQPRRRSGTARAAPVRLCPDRQGAREPRRLRCSGSDHREGVPGRWATEGLSPDRQLFGLVANRPRAVDLAR